MPENDSLPRKTRVGMSPPIDVVGGGDRDAVDRDDVDESVGRDRDVTSIGVYGGVFRTGRRGFFVRRIK